MVNPTIFHGKAGCIVTWAVLTVTLKLVEDVTLGWAESAGENLGITDPTAAAVLAVVWDWGVPMVFAGLIILFFLVYRDHRRQHMLGDQWNDR